MDYSAIFSYMYTEIALVGVTVLALIYDLMTGERGRRHFHSFVCTLMVLFIAGTVVPWHKEAGAVPVSGEGETPEEFTDSWTAPGKKTSTETPATDETPAESPVSDESLKEEQPEDSEATTIVLKPSDPQTEHEPSRSGIGVEIIIEPTVVDEVADHSSVTGN